MTSSPWWIPLVAAAIALLGVVVGQVLGAVIESRRNRREARQRAFEYWRDKRFDAYTEFVRSVDRYATLALQFSVLLAVGKLDENDPDIKDEDGKRQIREHNIRYEVGHAAESEAADEVCRTFAELQILIGGSATYKQFDALFRQVLDVKHMISLWETSEQAFVPSEIESIASIVAMIPEVLMAARTEMGIEFKYE